MPSSPFVSDAERAAITTHVAEGHRLLADEVAGLDDALWDRRPDPEAWSPAEIVEHVLLAERSLMQQVRVRSTDAPDADWEAKVDGRIEVLRRSLPGSGKAKAGPSVTGFGGLRREDVAASLADSARTLDELLVSAQDLPLKAILWNNKWFGDLSAYLWLLYIPLHTERHIGQLRRTKASLLTPGA